jgi:hypothetical protein
MADQGPGQENSGVSPDDRPGESTGADGEEIFEAEIVDEEIPGRAPVASPPPLIGSDVILAPCHHGCTCGLHVQATYGSRVPLHDPWILDHGEMGLLGEAAERAARRADEYHDYLAHLRALVKQAHGEAAKALTELEARLSGWTAGQADRDELEQERAMLTLDQRKPAPRWLKTAAVGSAIGVAIFDAYFFQQAFLTILQIGPGDPWWKRDIGLVVAVVFAVGVIAAGRVISGPVWRIRQRWHRPASPDEKPPGRLRLAFRATWTMVAPAAILLILAVWAVERGLQTAAGLPPGTAVPAGPVALLLLCLALIVIVLEVLVYNPYQAVMVSSKHELRRLLRADQHVTDALTVHDIAWRDLRSSQDEIITVIRTELARPWHTVILPARLRHGRAGPEPVAPEYGVEVKILPAAAIHDGVTGIDQVQITYQIFAGVTQPQPGPGPLAETIRTVLEYQPDDLQERHQRVQVRLLAAIGEPERAEAAS